jgi:hypothetical protein
MRPVLGAKALIPNPALAPLAFLIGEWRTSGTHPLLPDVPLEGLTSFAWHGGGAFLEIRSQVDEPHIPDGLAYIGSDDRSGAFTMIYFDEREISRIYAVEVDAAERRLTWSRDDPHLAQSMTVSAQPDGTLISSGRMSQDRGPWTDDLSQVFRPLQT